MTQYSLYDARSSIYKSMVADEGREYDIKHNGISSSNNS